MPLMSRSCCSAPAGIFSLYAVTIRSTGYCPSIDTSNVFRTDAIPTQVRLISVTPINSADVVAAVRFGLRIAFATAIRAGTPPPRAGSAPIKPDQRGHQQRTDREDAEERDHTAGDTDQHLVA